MRKRTYHILVFIFLLAISNLRATNQPVTQIPHDPQVQTYFENFTLTLDSAQTLHQTGEYQQAVRLYSTAFDLFKQFNQKRREHTEAYLAQYYETEQKEQQIQFLEKTLQFEKKQRISMILLCVIILTTLILSIFLFKYHLRNIRQQAQQKENEAQLIELEKQKCTLETHLYATEIEKYQKQLFAENLLVNQKNRVLNDLRHFFAQNPTFTPYQAELETILQKEHIHTETTTSATGIDSIHPVFYTRLQEQADNKLTTLDLEYCRMISMKLSSKQMADILQVDPATIRTTKYRLKQKLGLTKEQDLPLFIHQMASGKA